MMILRDFMDNYWAYYLDLEKRVIETRKYVEFDVANYKTYSMEYLILLEAICSELDAVGKIAAQLNNPDFKVDHKTNIQKWGYEFQSAFPDYEGKIAILQGRMEISPYKKWKYEKNGNRYKLAVGYETPFWWNAYNNVKHQRTACDAETGAINYKNANLKNVLFALSALFLAERFILEKNYCLPRFAKEVNRSKLFMFDTVELMTALDY